MEPRAIGTPPLVRRIHNPVLHGRALLLLPEGLLVRWPARSALPAVGDRFTGTTVNIPPDFSEAVQTLLFGQSPIERCDAAKLLARTRQSRSRILLRIYSRSYAQQLLAAAERFHPELRQEIAAHRNMMSVHRLTRAIYGLKPGNDNG